MFSELLSFCLMDVSSNLEVFLSEKHLNDHKDRELFIMAKPAMEINDEECQASAKEDHELKTRQQTVQEQRDHQEDEDHQVQQQSNDDNVTVLPAALKGLKLKIPPYKEVQEETEKERPSNDGFKTPTSPQHRIPEMLQCPPAPRKPRATSSSTKRKGCCRSRTVLDLSQEIIESLFPTVDRGASGKNKKVKLFTEPQ